MRGDAMNKYNERQVKQKCAQGQQQLVGSQREPKVSQRGPKVNQRTTKVHPKVDLRKNTKIMLNSVLRKIVWLNFWSHLPVKF